MFRFAALLEKMLMLDPAKRISVKEAMAHPFFADDVAPPVAPAQPTA